MGKKEALLCFLGGGEKVGKYKSRKMGKKEALLCFLGGEKK